MSALDLVALNGVAQGSERRTQSDALHFFPGRRFMAAAALDTAAMIGARLAGAIAPGFNHVGTNHGSFTLPIQLEYLSTAV